MFIQENKYELIKFEDGKLYNIKYYNLGSSIKDVGKKRFIEES